MFETSAVLARPNISRQRRFALATVSIALHSAAITGALFFTIWNVDLPDRAPNQIAAYALLSDVPIPAGGGGAPQPPRSEPNPIRPAQQPAPESIPQDVKPVEPSTVVTNQSVTGRVGDGPAAATTSGDVSGFGDRSGTAAGPGAGNEIGDALASDAAPERYVVGGNVKAPVTTLRVDPIYPESLRAIRLHGSAVVECVIGTDGRPKEIRVLRASHVLFGVAASEAVERWRFRPGTLDGRTVETILTLRVDFALN